MGVFRQKGRLHNEICKVHTCTKSFVVHLWQLFSLTPKLAIPRFNFRSRGLP